MDWTEQSAEKPVLGARGDDNVMSTTFDADLARANLMRLRSEYKKAENICIGILHQFPKSAAAHTLLADIYLDQGMLDRAEQWYGLSLDLDPNSQYEQQKLADVREQIKEREQIFAADQLGLPEPSPNIQSWKVGGIAVAVILVGILGYAIRYGRIGNNTEPQVIKTPIKATVDNMYPAYVNGGPRTNAGPPALSNVNPIGDRQATPAVFPKDDNELKSEVTQKCKFGQRLLSLTQDLKSKITTVVFQSVEAEDQREVAAELAKSVFELTDDPDTVIVRGMRKDKPVYQAEVPRQRYEETLSDEWQQKNTAPDAWIAYILTNELFAKELAEAAAAAANGPSTDPDSQASTTTATTGGTEKAGEDKTASDKTTGDKSGGTTAS